MIRRAWQKLIDRKRPRIDPPVAARLEAEMQRVFNGPEVTEAVRAQKPEVLKPPLASREESKKFLAELEAKQREAQLQRDIEEKRLQIEAMQTFRSNGISGAFGGTGLSSLAGLAQQQALQAPYQNYFGLEAKRMLEAKQRPVDPLIAEFEHMRRDLEQLDRSGLAGGAVFHSLRRRVELQRKKMLEHGYQWSLERMEWVKPEKKR